MGTLGTGIGHPKMCRCPIRVGEAGADAFALDECGEKTRGVTRESNAGTVKKDVALGTGESREASTGE